MMTIRMTVASVGAAFAKPARPAGPGRRKGATIRSTSCMRSRFRTGPPERHMIRVAARALQGARGPENDGMTGTCATLLKLGSSYARWSRVGDSPLYGPWANPINEHRPERAETGGRGRGAGARAGRPPPGGGRGAAEAAQAAAVPGGAAERRLHADGIRGRRAGTHLQPQPDAGDKDHAGGTYPGQRHLRGLHIRDRGDQSGAGDDIFPAAPAPAAVHHGGDLIAVQ